MFHPFSATVALHLRVTFPHLTLPRYKLLFAFFVRCFYIQPLSHVLCFSEDIAHCYHSPCVQRFCRICSNNWWPGSSHVVHFFHGGLFFPRGVIFSRWFIFSTAFTGLLLLSFGWLRGLHLVRFLFFHTFLLGYCKL